MFCKRILNETENICNFDRPKVHFGRIILPYFVYYLLSEDLLVLTSERTLANCITNVKRNLSSTRLSWLKVNMMLIRNNMSECAVQLSC